MWHMEDVDHFNPRAGPSCCLTDDVFIDYKLQHLLRDLGPTARIFCLPIYETDRFILPEVQRTTGHGTDFSQKQRACCN